MSGRSRLAWRRKSCPKTLDDGGDSSSKRERELTRPPSSSSKLRRPASSSSSSSSSTPFTIITFKPYGRAFAYCSAVLLLWWLASRRTRYESLKSTSTSSSPSSILLPGDRVVWGLAEESVKRVSLPEPEEDKYIALVQAAVVSQEETYRHRRGIRADYFLQVLSIIGEHKPPQRFETWQVFVRQATYLKHVECTWSTPNGTTFRVQGSLRIPWMWDMSEPASGAALLLQCPVAKRWEETMALGQHQARDPDVDLLAVDIHLDIEGSESGLDLPTITLRDYRPPPKTVVGMCTAPVYGDWKPDDWIDWREHHKLLGFGPVHWYSRDNVLHEFLRDYATFNASGDSYRYAPPVNPEVYNTELLSNSGLYSDQVVLAMDCMLRSKYLGPSEWLAFFDMDEYFIPDPMPTTRERRAASAADFLATFDSHVPSVSLGRTHNGDNAHLELAARNNEELRMFPRMSSLTLIRDPHKDDPPGNHKHMHRVNAVEASSVHAPTELYPGHVYMPPMVPAPVRLVHLGSSIYNTGPYIYFDNGGAMDAFRNELYHGKKAAYMEWKGKADALDLGKKLG